MRYLSILSLVPVAFLPAVSPASDGDGGRYWFGLDATLGMSPQFDLKLDITVRESPGFHRMVRIGTEIGVAWKPADWLKITPSLSLNHDSPEPEDERDEVRPALDLALKYDLGEWEFVFGNSLEYRYLTGDTDTARWRPRVSVERRIGSKELGLRCFVSNELFFDFKDDTFTKNRIFAGLEKTLSEHWSTKVFYGRQHGLNGHSSDEHIIGISFDFEWDLYDRKQSRGGGK